jgi:hypothetical protein
VSTILLLWITPPGVTSGGILLLLRKICLQ